MDTQVWNDMIARAEWSDQFFNSDLAVGANTNEELREAALEFLRENPSCPYSAEWLVVDFNRRV